MADIEELQNHIGLKFLKQYEDALSVIIGAEKPVRIISHYDADGLCAASLLGITLRRAGIDFHISISRALDAGRIAELKKENNELLAFCDMGSGQIDIIEKSLEGTTVVIFDHHYPLRESTKVHQVNPHFTDIDGTQEACASTVLFLFSIGVSRDNWDLFHIALAGAIGDKQHLGGLKGLNMKLLDAAASKGLVTVSRELLLDSTHLFECLYETLEPYFTGISGRRDGVEKFLKKAGLEGSATLGGLAPEMKSKLKSLLALKIISQGAKRDIVEGLISDRYWSETKKADIREFSSLVNACGRMGKEEAGIGYCMGDGESVAEAIKIRNEYRAKVRDGLLKLEREGPKKKRHIQYFNSPDPSIAGSHAGVAMMYFIDQEKPVLALSRVGKELRVSTRGTPHLISRGLDLAAACRSVSEVVGGHGGGHDIAAGATIPFDKEEEFLDKMDEFIGSQFEAGLEQE
jgi:RecJ-like exonuclease